MQPFIELSNYFEEINALERHDFGGAKARYETTSEEHHDHLIDLETGVIEFQDHEIEELQKKIAERLGYRLQIDHRLELYAVPLDNRPKK